MAKRKALGRGLGALIPGADAQTEPEDQGTTAQGRRILDVDVSAVEPNPHQPRASFNPESVAELARSIEEKGVIQPITVRRFGSGYQLVAGERRLRAARQAGLQKIPVIVATVVTDQEMMELSLIENIQREDLNPIEEAKAYRMLLDECFLSQEEVAKRVGKQRSTVANTLRLLNLADEVREALQSGKISMGHARALLAIEEQRAQIALCRQVVARGLSVRRIEALVRAASDGASPRARQRPSKDPEVVTLEEDLQHRFGTGVNIQRRGTRGRIEFEFYSDEDFERLMDLLRGDVV